MSQLVFDAEAARKIEAIYQIGDARRRRAIVREALGARPGERVLDVGCGPGFYCAEIAEEVGTSGSVVGLDASPAMLGLAARRCEPFANVELRESEATSLPVGDGEFDAVLSVQVQEYVADLDRSLAELHRCLRPGGRVVVFDVDWATLSVHSEDETLTQRVLGAWDEHLAHPSLPRTLIARLRAAGFDEIRMDAHAFSSAERDPETYGVALIPFIGAFVAGRAGVSEAEAQAWVDEQMSGDYYFAITQCCFTARRS